MKNNVYPCELQFYYLKLGFKGVKIILAFFFHGGQKVNRNNKKSYLVTNNIMMTMLTHITYSTLNA